MSNKFKPKNQENAHYFGEYAYLAIDKHFSKIIQYEIEVLKDKDPENLHQMRVSMRRLRSVITGFSPALILPKSAAEDQIGKIGKILGKLRDIDVLKETLETIYLPKLPKSESKYLKQALFFLKHQRKFAFKKVKHLLKSNSYQKFKKVYSNWLENPNFQAIAYLSIYPILPDLLFPQLSKFLLHPGWLLGLKIEEGQIKFQEKIEIKTVEKILSHEGTILHDLRKEAKRSRYNMELFTNFYGEEYQDYVGNIKALQTILGDIQDCYVLSEFLSGIFDFDLIDKMPNLVNIFKEIRYQKWQEWVILQKYFFEIPSGLLLTERQKIRDIIQYVNIEDNKRKNINDLMKDDHQN